MIKPSHADKQEGRCEGPGFGGKEAPPWQIGQHIAPTRQGLANAEAHEGKRDFGEHVGGHEQGRLDRYRAISLWEHVAPE